MKREKVAKAVKEVCERAETNLDWLVVAHNLTPLSYMNVEQLLEFALRAKCLAMDVELLATRKATPTKKARAK